MASMADEIKKLKLRVQDLERQMRQLSIEKNILVGELAKHKKEIKPLDDEFHD